MRVSSGVGCAGLLGAALLSGCGGSGPLTVAEQFDHDLSKAQVMEDRIGALSRSPFDIFVAAGQVTYIGYATVGVATADQTINLVGETRIAADFDSNAVTGTMTGFIGQATPAGGGVVNTAPYSGAIDLSSGLVDGPNRPNQFGADFAGTLTGGGNVIAIDGAMIGDFHGGPLRNGVLGVSTGGLTTAEVNGVTATADLAVAAWADRDL